MKRTLTLMGSGETTPSMVETHKRILADITGRAVLIDTPYGFQENADELTARTQAYFAHNVGRQIDAVQLRDADALGPVASEAAVQSIAAAQWLFAGPGSPSHAVRQWSATRFAEVARERLSRPGATVFASAGACTVGKFSIPVYEIYKVGEAPHWTPGLDLLSVIDLAAVVVPHWDNKEGGTHDTRHCYLGARRLALLVEQLPDGIGILGIDEHTAAVLDLDQDTLHVEGRGTVVARDRDGAETVWRAGVVVALDDVRAALAGTHGNQVGRATSGAAPAPDAAAPADDDTVSFASALAALEASFDAAMAREQGVSAAGVVMQLHQLLADWGADPTQGEEMPRAQRALRRCIVALGTVAEAGMHDHRELIAPHVHTLLELREAARDAKDFAEADRIRAALAEGQVVVNDTPGGSEWEFADPTG
ncbi:MAG: hypothetical protein ACI867_000986 [Glaciecola sp.]|jgi:hypothetical protein